MNFKEFHQDDSPLLICNVWDVESARIAQKLKYKAIGTSSGAIASMLGYQDGEEMTFDELEYIVCRITKSVDVPLSVDLEAGYSRNPNLIVENVKRLEQLGVVGVNIEDSLVDVKRELVDRDVFSNILVEVCSQLSNQNVSTFINVRTDPFLLGLENATQETLLRAQQYKDAGADGLFVPCIEKQQDIKAIIEHIDLPLNVMCMPNLPNFEVLRTLGVKRISMGNFVYTNVSNALEKTLSEIQSANCFDNLFV